MAEPRMRRYSTVAGTPRLPAVRAAQRGLWPDPRITAAEPSLRHPFEPFQKQQHLSRAPGGGLASCNSSGHAHNASVRARSVLPAIGAATRAWGAAQNSRTIDLMNTRASFNVAKVTLRA